MQRWKCSSCFPPRRCVIFPSPGAVALCLFRVGLGASVVDGGLDFCKVLIGHGAVARSGFGKFHPRQILRQQRVVTCYGKLIVELKAVTLLADEHRAQVINYLKATGLKRGLLLNFGAPSLQYKRFVLSPANL